MKIIAFFTMIYLPGSFVSSIFGWSIISFSVDEATNRQSIVVGEQWKWYVAITVSLTVATALCVSRKLPSAISIVVHGPELLPELLLL